MVAVVAEYTWSARICMGLTGGGASRLMVEKGTKGDVNCERPTSKSLDRVGAPNIKCTKKDTRLMQVGKRNYVQHIFFI